MLWSAGRLSGIAISHFVLAFAIFVVDLICTRQAGEVTTLNNNKLCKSNEGEKDAWNAAPSSPHGNHCPVLFFPLSRSLIYRLATCDFCCLGNCFPNPLSLPAICTTTIFCVYICMLRRLFSFPLFAF